MHVMQTCMLTCMSSRQHACLTHDMHVNARDAGATGMYGQQGEWKAQYSRGGSNVAARPIMSAEGAQGEGGAVQSIARYQHCASITGQYPDYNLLHALPLSNLHQQCRDDEMHMFRLGLMLHMFSGVCARYIRALHPLEPSGGGAGQGTPGVAGMKRVFERLGGRLQGAQAGLMSEYVSQSFLRAFSTFSADRNPHGGAYKWGLTAAEAEQLFMIVPFALDGLMQLEIQAWQGRQGSRGPGTSPCPYSDPTLDIVRVLSRFTSWYMVMQTQELKDDEVRGGQYHVKAAGCVCRVQAACGAMSWLPGRPDAGRVGGQLDELHREAGSIVADLRSVLPERNLGVPTAGLSRAQRGPESEQASEEEGAESSSDDAREDTQDPSLPLAARGSNAWNLPKVHALFHLTTGIRLFGPLQGSSGESLERRHVDVKTAFTHTNNHKQCELQVLKSEMRKDDSTAGAKRPREDTEDGDRAGARAKQPRVNASFADTLHHSARRYPVWFAAQHWRSCKRQLKFAAKMVNVMTQGGHQSQAQVTIPMMALYDASSQWRDNCADMKWLPAELARYIRDEFSAHWGKGQFPKAGEDALTWPQITQLCGLIQPCSSRGSHGAAQRHGPAETHLQVYNALEIAHPDVPGEV